MIKKNGTGFRLGKTLAAMLMYAICIVSTAEAFFVEGNVNKIEPRQLLQQVSVKIPFSSAVRGYGGRAAGTRIATSLRTSVIKPRGTVPKSALNFTSELAPRTSTSQRRFRAALGVKPFENARAHHIVPVELRAHPIVQRAAKGGFNINGRHNGVWLSKVKHPSNHRGYSKRVKDTLDGIWEKTKSKRIKDWQYAQLINNLNRVERRILLGQSYRVR